jgi:hypothetical protein
MTEDAALEVAERQRGLITRWQAALAGLDARGLRYRTRPGGRWQRVLPDVFAVVTGELTDEQRRLAALLHVQRVGMLSCATAAAALGLRYVPGDGRVHVVVPHRRHFSDAGFFTVHRTQRMDRHPLTVGSLTIVSAARAVADTCRELTDLRAVRALVAEAVQRGRTTVPDLERELRDGKSAGSALLRRAVGDVAAGVRSAPEAELRDLISTSTVLPEPRWNPWLVDDDGRDLGRPDGWWREASRAVEMDSREWHLSPADHERTLLRHRRMEAAGLGVVHLTPGQLRRDGAAVLGDLERCYLEGMRQARRARVRERIPPGWSGHAR